MNEAPRNEMADSRGPSGEFLFPDLRAPTVSGDVVSDPSYGVLQPIVAVLADPAYDAPITGVPVVLGDAGPADLDPAGDTAQPPAVDAVVDAPAVEAQVPLAGAA